MMQAKDLIGVVAALLVAVGGTTLAYNEVKNADTPKPYDLIRDSPDLSQHQTDSVVEVLGAASRGRNDAEIRTDAMRSLERPITAAARRANGVENRAEEDPRLEPSFRGRPEDELSELVAARANIVAVLNREDVPQEGFNPGFIRAVELLEETPELGELPAPAGRPNPSIEEAPDDQRRAVILPPAPAVAEAPRQVCGDDRSSIPPSQGVTGRENPVVCGPALPDSRERRQPQPPVESISDNMSILAVFPAPDNGRVNDVWSSSTDLVLVGKFLDGWAVVDVSNPFLPTEIASTGVGMLIKDVKGEGDIVVANNERGSFGAGAVLYDVNNPFAPVELARITSPLALSVHNVFLSDGFVYLSSNTTRRVEIFDVRVPSNPVHVASVADDNGRIHDTVVVDGRLYSSFLDGGFRIHDVSDPTAPVLLASQDYEGAVTHNAWPSADGRFLFTTDEVAGGHLRVWDLGEVGGGQGPVRQVGRFVASQRAIIHNVFVKDEIAYASYYTAGLRIIDVSTPRLPVEVAVVDTFPGEGDVFDGAWGVFPADEDGIVYLTDVDTGLWVLRFDGRIAEPPADFTGRAVLERSALFARNVFELTWSSHPQAVGYNIYRAQPDQPFTRVSDTPQFSTRFIETGPLETREYAVTAVLLDQTESRPTPILRLEASR